MTEKTHSTCISPARSSYCHATKIILVTHPRTGDLCEPLKYIYNLYVEYVAKNPLYIPLELQSGRCSVQPVSLWKSLNRMSGILLKCRKEGKYILNTSFPVKAVWHGQFLPLQQLQDESNPDFVVEVVFLFFDDSKKLLNDLTIACIAAQRVKNACIAFCNFFEEQNIA
ncbi:hypothetical protein QUC31_018071, partial [Theobroma cacao]